MGPKCDFLSGRFDLTENLKRVSNNRCPRSLIPIVTIFLENIDACHYDMWRLGCGTISACRVLLTVFREVCCPNIISIRFICMLFSLQTFCFIITYSCPCQILSKNNPRFEIVVVFSCVLKMEMAGSCRIFIPVYQIMWPYITQDYKMKNQGFSEQSKFRLWCRLWHCMSIHCYRCFTGRFWLHYQFWRPQFNYNPYTLLF
jgi:hypothetical protein